MPKNTISKGVIFNAYPDSMGSNLSDVIKVLKKPAFKNVFSLFYILPTFFNSDLDRGFSIIDYNLNNELVSKDDLKDLEEINIQLKFDIVLNHLSIASPQFKDLLKHGEQSKYKDFFINWNTFWQGKGEMGKDGVIIPKEEFLNKLFMRKPGLPVLKVPFPNGSKQPYWNTFYQKVIYNNMDVKDLENITELTIGRKKQVVKQVNKAIENNVALYTLDFGVSKETCSKVVNIVERKCTYLGQMDVNANSELVWDFYEETLQKLSAFGCKILRLDAFAYLDKKTGHSNFFNRTGTWRHLERIKQIAKKNSLVLLPEIHAEYGSNLHKEVAAKGYYFYDFFLPGLIIHTIENRNSKALISWANEIINGGYKTVNMLGCHDGIPILDLKGKEVDGIYNKGLLEDAEIEEIMNTILERGGIVKNLYDSSGKKISYYQVNATFFSALGENKQKMLLARAIQMFMPGTPQVWYLDVFVGKNDYEAVNKIKNGGHKEINRTTLCLNDIEEGLKNDIVKNQLKLIRLRNTSKAFLGDISIKNTTQYILDIKWLSKENSAHLKVNLQTYTFSIEYIEEGNFKTMFFDV